MRRICLYHISKRFYQNEDLLSIRVPKKIYRDDLSVLKALAGTVQREFGYIPPDINYKHVSFLSDGVLEGRKEGIKAFNNNGKFFGKFASENPLIKSIMPIKSGESLKSDFEAGLICYDEYMHSLMFVETPKNIFEIFSETKDTNSYSHETIVKLMELFCATNCKNSTIYLENYVDINNKRTVKNLIPPGKIDELFESIDEKSGLIYEAMIRGKAKQNNFKSAEKYLIEMEEKGFSVSDIETINDYLLSKRITNENAKEIFEDIKRRGLTPNIETFNNVIKYLSSEILVKQILNEALFLGLEFNLNTLNNLIRYNNNKINYLVLLELENRRARIDFEDITNVNDIDLIYKLMTVIVKSNLYEWVERLHKVLVAGGRIHLIKNISSVKNMSFWSHFLTGNLEIIGRYKVLKMLYDLSPEYSLMYQNQFEVILDSLDPSFGNQTSERKTTNSTDDHLACLRLLLILFSSHPGSLQLSARALYQIRQVLAFHRVIPGTENVNDDEGNVVEIDLQARSDFHNLFLFIIQKIHLMNINRTFCDPDEAQQFFQEFGSSELVMEFINLLAHKSMLTLPILRDSLLYFTRTDQVIYVQEVLDCVSKNADSLVMSKLEKDVAATHAMLALLTEEEDTAGGSEDKARSLLCNSGFDSARINEVVGILNETLSNLYSQNTVSTAISK